MTTADPARRHRRRARLARHALPRPGERQRRRLRLPRAGARGLARALWAPSRCRCRPTAATGARPATREPLAEAARQVMLEIAGDGPRARRADPVPDAHRRRRQALRHPHRARPLHPRLRAHRRDRGAARPPPGAGASPSPSCSRRAEGVQTPRDRNASTAAKTSSLRPTQTCPPVGKLDQPRARDRRRDVARGGQGLEAVVLERERQRRRPDRLERHRLRRAGELAVVQQAAGAVADRQDVVQDRPDPRLLRRARRRARARDRWRAACRSSRPRPVVMPSQNRKSERRP